MCDFLKLLAGGLLVASTTVTLVVILPKKRAFVIPYGVFAYGIVSAACWIAEVLAATM